MKTGKPFLSEFGAYGETVVTLLSFVLVVATAYWLIRIGCGDLFKWVMGN